jgi:hypothetical protein
MNGKIMFRIALVLAAIVLPACGSGGFSSPAAEVKGTAFVLTSDYTTGSYAVVNTSTRSSTSNIGAVFGDSSARANDKLVYVLNKMGADNVQVLNPASGYSTTLQFSTGAGTNPQDIAFSSASKAYISLLGSADVLIVNPATGQQTGAINLSAYADADGLPEASQLAIKNGKLFIAAQNLFSWAPAGTSRVIVADANTGAVTADIAMPYQNQSGSFVELPSGKLAIACAGNYGVNDGGLVIIDPATLTAAKGGLTEQALGGDLISVAMVTETAGFAVVSDSAFNTVLKKFDTATGAVSDVYATQGYKLSGMALNGGELWIADRTDTNPGVRVFDSSTGAQLTSAPVSVGLPPVSILFM